MKRLHGWIALALLQALFLSTAFFAGYLTRAFTPGDERGLRLPLTGNHPLLDQALGLLQDHFIGELPEAQTLERGAVRGLVEAVGDPYTVFIEPQANELQTQSLQGEYGGVGMTLGFNEAHEIALSPFLDSPAAAAGILEGDVLLAVDDQSIAVGQALDEVSALVRGPIGSNVRLKVRHPDASEQTFVIIRQRFEIPSVTWKMVDGQSRLGLVAISRFSDKTAGEVERALIDLDAQGADRYVLDLRDNGGGILEAAVDTASHFLDGGVVMYETQRGAPERIYSATGAAGPGLRAPLAVLVNQNTASAAEILAGALLDRGRAPLIGQPTFGKGTVQLVYDLADGSSLHVTAFHWFTPSRRDLNTGGLPPTYVVEPATDGSDPILNYAILYLNGAAAVHSTAFVPGEHP